MNKNFSQQLLLGVALFITFMYIMQTFFPPPAKQDDAPTAASNTTTAVTPTVQPAAASAFTPGDSSNTPVTPYENINITTESFNATFSTRGAGLKSYTFTKFFNLPQKSKDPQRIPLPLIAQMDNGALSLAMEKININGKITFLPFTHWHLVQIPTIAEKIPGVKQEGNTLKFQTTVGSLVITHVYEFTKDYGFKHYFVFNNTDNTPVSLNYTLTATSGIIPDDTDQRFGLLMGISGYFKAENDIAKNESGLSDLKDKESFTHENANTAWAGLHNRFFTSLLISSQPDQTKDITFSKLSVDPAFPATFGSAEGWMKNVIKSHPQEARVTLARKTFVLNAKASQEHNYEYYGGPLSDNYAEVFNPVLKNIVSYSFSWLGSISRLLLKILGYIVDIVKNYGIAIVILTMLVKICLHPLTRKTLTSQKKMQKIQPLLKQLKEKYKDDKQKQQMETMKLFQEHGVSPVGGCLPMLIQLPIFFALYGVFAHSFSMRQQVFIPGWINDLSSQDALFNLGFSVPYFEWTTFNLLPIIYVVFQIIQMNMMPKNEDPQMQSQQKMMKMMPLIMAFIFYSMPSGLVLYFVTNTLLTVVEHKLLKKDDLTKSTSEVATTEEAAAAVPAGTGFSNTGKSKKNKKK